FALAACAQSTDAVDDKPDPAVGTVLLSESTRTWSRSSAPSKATRLPPHRDWDCAVTLKVGAVPSRCRIYPLFQEEEQAIGQYIKEALQQAYIRSSTSLASAGVFFVKKRDGRLRPCVDYQGLNKLLVQYPYPLPLVPALEQLRGARYFTKLDLRSTYNLIQIKEVDEWKIAFSTSMGHYEYLVLPYSLATAPSTFQVYINEVHREFLGRSVVAYINDILIYFPSWNQHVRDVWAMLQTLLVNHLYCKAEKCEFHCKEVNFLGIKCTQEVDKAFEELKNAFATTPVLQQPDPKRPFLIEVDASDIGVGAGLSQHMGDRGGLRPITHFS
ncbi:hypothetical protein P4O66_010105, partial [Electrophorus voltai]